MILWLVNWIIHTFIPSWLPLVDWLNGTYDFNRVGITKSLFCVIVVLFKMFRWWPQAKSSVFFCFFFPPIVLHFPLVQSLNEQTLSFKEENWFRFPFLLFHFGQRISFLCATIVSLDPVLIAYSYSHVILIKLKLWTWSFSLPLMSF